MNKCCSSRTMCIANLKESEKRLHESKQRSEETAESYSESYAQSFHTVALIFLSLEGMCSILYEQSKILRCGAGCVLSNIKHSWEFKAHAHRGSQT